MRLFTILHIILACISFTLADLTCLEWTFISPVVGLVCHFAPTTFHKTENKVISTVENAVNETLEKGYDLIQFDIKHSPITVVYEYISKSINEGQANSSAYLEEIGLDYVNVTIGFAKESANQFYTIVNALEWTDVSVCEIEGAKDFYTAYDKRSLAGKTAMTLNAGIDIVHNCVKKKIVSIVNDKLFNITDANQQVGATISDIAPLLVDLPVGIEAGGAAARGSVDLVIEGSEDTTRILKRTGPGKFDHFTNTDEALPVKRKLEDPAWAKENCFFKQPVISRGAVGGIPSLGRRAGPTGPNIYCNLVKDLENLSLEQQAEDARTIEEEGADLDGYESVEENTVEFFSDLDLVESDLTPPPVIATRPLSDKDGILQDLLQESTAQIPWSEDLARTYNSDDMLASLRKILENPDDPLYSKMKATEDEGRTHRPYIDLTQLEDAPELKIYRDFTAQVVKDLKEADKALNKVTAAEVEGADPLVMAYYYKAGEEGLSAPYHFHFDPFDIGLSVSDTEGLVIGNSAKFTSSRLPVAKNAWQLIKGEGWEEYHIVGKTYRNVAETWHAIFGPEQAARGRMSIVASLHRIVKYHN